MYIAHSLGLATKLPAFKYQPLNTRAKQMKEVPGLWARNLLANRLYQCPVLFLEPYVMNNEECYARVQAGLYEGERLVAGRMRPSLYHEYVEGIVQGLVAHYTPDVSP